MTTNKIFFAVITLFIISSFYLKSTIKQISTKENSIYSSLVKTIDTVKKEVIDPYKRHPFLIVNPRNKKSEAIIDFRYRGRTINHLILNEFVGFVASDRHSAIREIDLTVGNESNRFYYNEDDLFIQKTGRLNFIALALKEDFLADETFLKYNYLGELANGVHVVYFIEDSEVSNYEVKTIIGVRFHKENVFYEKKPHVFITCVKLEGINQYVDFKLDARNNRLKVIPMENYTQKDLANMDKNSFWVEFDEK